MYKVTKNVSRGAAVRRCCSIYFLTWKWARVGTPPPLSREIGPVLEFPVRRITAVSLSRNRPSLEFRLVTTFSFHLHTILTNLKFPFTRIFFLFHSVLTIQGLANHYYHYLIKKEIIQVVKLYIKILQTRKSFVNLINYKNGIREKWKKKDTRYKIQDTNEKRKGKILWYRVEEKR